MKKKIMISCLLAWVAVFGFSGVAISGGGGPEDPACDNLPEPTRGKYISGTFIASMDKSSCSQEFQMCKHFNIQVELKLANQVHLYSFPATLGTGNLCDFTADNLKTKFARTPCALGVGNDFMLQGTPVIKLLKITHQQCDDQIIKGDIDIRVVP